MILRQVADDLKNQGANLFNGFGGMLLRIDKFLAIVLKNENLAIERLVNAVERFRVWAEGDRHRLVEARQLLLELMICIPALEGFRYSGKEDSDFPTRGHDGWMLDLARFADLPFQYYRVVFDPHDPEATDEPVMGDLHDDLADIYADLWHGHHEVRVGDFEKAVAIWVDSYFFHWGRHASSAVRAIDTYYGEN